MNQLAYETFSREVLLRIQERIGGDSTFSIQKVTKNNDVELDGIIMHSSSCTVSPTFYMEQLYEEYTDGASIDEIVDFTSSFYELPDELEMPDLSTLESFERAKDRIAFKVVNYETNRKKLAEIPHFKYLDLAIEFYCVLSQDPFGVGSVLISNQMLEDWEVSKSDLYEAAVQNTKRMFGIEIKDLKSSILDSLSDDDLFPASEEQDSLRKDIAKGVEQQIMRIPIYVMTNRRRLNGAVCMLYKEVETFAEQLEDDLFIVPSSIHEVLLVPVSSNIERSQLEMILQEINREELEATDFLSDTVYYYDRATRHISCD